ncbi:MAG: ribosome biogenesis GTPase Der [Verrucomicrobia bacterium]|nr:ribosome biogenesis GTPase Der [Verrucomicrobiota bacterium]
MSQLTKVAIVGRPNVGKSALFNAICKKRIAIVDDAEGITRDRQYAQTESFGFPFEIIDTGGIDTKKEVLFHEEIRRQAEIAIEEADSIIMVVDGVSGPQDIDRDIATILHRSKKPLCLAVNKIDALSMQHLAYTFASLGIERVIGVSATHNFQIAELLEAALTDIPTRSDTEQEEDGSIKVAIVGRTNVGKSTLINSLLGEERCIVSPIAGTTRDSIDSRVSFDDTLYTFIDTAGIRRRHKELDVVEKFAFIRTEQAIERSEVCLLIVDATQGLTTEEKKIAKAIEEAKKGCIVLFNKWDLTQGFRMEHVYKHMEMEVPFLRHCPKLCISAATGRNLEKIYPEIQKVAAGMQQRITTGQLNKCLIAAMQKTHPSVIGGKRLRVYYMAQVGIAPPHFVLFVNSPLLMEESYKRYLVNNLRDTFGFVGVPIIFRLKAKESIKDRRARLPKHTDRDLSALMETQEASNEEDL